MNTSSTFEPSALSSFGKLPPSHVLVHLLLAILEIIQELCSSPGKDDDNSIPDAKHAAADEKDILHTEELNVIGDAHGKTQFLLNSTTASLLIASLHLSSQLRDSALKSLNDSIISSDEAFNASMIMGDVGRIQIAHTSALECSEVDDPLIEKDDPAGLESAATSSGFEAESSAKDNSESLESKGLNRKAAAAVQIACLRSETKQKFVQTLTNRVALYSTCCILNLKCFRVLIGKSMENAGVASSSGKNSLNVIETEVDEKPNPASDVLSLSTKTRLSLLQLLSNFYGSAASRNFQSLKLSMINFYRRNDETLLPRVESLGDQLLVAELCNESLCLWGYAMPVLYSDHQARVELLGNMLEALLSSTSAPIEVDDSRYNIAASNNSIKSCTWSDYEMQCWKIDIVCKRLRVSDMLDSFVAAPIIDGIDAKVKFDQTKEKSNLRPSTTASPTTSDRQTSLRILSLLSKSILKQSPGDGESNNLTKFYLALFQRLTTVLILWNDLSISSIDANDHDISGGESSFNAGSFGGIGSYRGDGESLQINPNPESFHFDSTKCADSVSLTSSSLSLPITANQRATKVWGTVLSTTCFLPKSGVHRWAIRLDKCERGHVFVGVSTARTNLKTYVGGDSHGWGLIGTQALWHDRSKLRGDYGSTFRTGAVVVVTLDTNVGTLSFGLWKDGASTPDSTHTPVLTHSLIGSPRRLPLHGHTGGGPFIEDWGIAFEGLPLDVKLYPGKHVHPDFR